MRLVPSNNVLTIAECAAQASSSFTDPSLQLPLPLGGTFFLFLFFSRKSRLVSDPTIPIVDDHQQHSIYKKNPRSTTAQTGPSCTILSRTTEKRLNLWLNVDCSLRNQSCFVGCLVFSVVSGAQSFLSPRCWYTLSYAPSALQHDHLPMYV